MWTKARQGVLQCRGVYPEDEDPPPLEATTVQTAAEKATAEENKATAEGATEIATKRATAEEAAPKKATDAKAEDTIAKIATEKTVEGRGEN